MNRHPQQLNLAQWEERYDLLQKEGMDLPPYCVPLSTRAADGDSRLEHLRFDESSAALRLWNFLLSEEQRLKQARDHGEKLIGTMKDLGTIPVMAFALDKCRAFYPDGAWWIPCVMEMGAGLLSIADQLGIDDSFCPVRAMLGAFVTKAHFPIPDLLTCNVGAVCDDFSAIAQRLEGLGFPILWWEMPPRRAASVGEEAVSLPGGFETSDCQIAMVHDQLRRIQTALEEVAGQSLTEARLQHGIRRANSVRASLRELRQQVYLSDLAPLPSLEMLIVEMLALHFCSDLDETINVLQGLLQEVSLRRQGGQGFGKPDSVRLYWVNPVADLRVMNLLEECQGRICGTEYLFSHALDPIPVDRPPLEALACMGLADPMVGSSFDRARRICHDIQFFRAEGVVISRIPGASHCAWEGQIIQEQVQRRLGLPVVEIEVSPVTDAMCPTLQTRLEALVETIKKRRKT